MTNNPARRTTRTTATNSGAPPAPPPPATRSRRAPQPTDEMAEGLAVAKNDKLAAPQAKMSVRAKRTPSAQAAVRISDIQAEMAIKQAQVERPKPAPKQTRQSTAKPESTAAPLSTKGSKPVKVACVAGSGNVQDNLAEGPGAQTEGGEKAGGMPTKDGTAASANGSHKPGRINQNTTGNGNDVMGDGHL
ncbi:hypothetical protein CONPUDRAFT_150434 [Coniophora puteana RWD-64-598 SS2]|uniref:Uncharacterized protein n=1 Tax=Coniophora puteana (strain RWD-64-598) TaxID=741705 RepID=A0A5M3N2M2_CONPW|nr:uncharacterized protein CONPUDRAFT_150434 [Coniophora puteana RWD-64-598 SS2]EIW85633.1 hypothetical protein CONPUDRAFT_150434 [Coniophora puteana RWD-64-598 SS2]